MTLLDEAHKAAAALGEDSSAAEVREVLVLFREAAWPDGRVLARGTIAWLLADFLPRWLDSPEGREP